MATVDSQQSWLPYDRRSKGCSQGFCSIYCPQWCYALFPPPAPLSLAGAEDDSGTTLSPLVIAIISILATAILLVSYYIFVSKRSASPFFHRRTILLEEPSAAAIAAGEEGVGGLHDDCHLPQSSEQEEALINTVWRYKRGERLVEGTDCSVCLSEFREGESIRLLPKCSHAFHLQCIDTWLKSHPNCPLCRDIVMSATPAKSEREGRIAAAFAAEQELEIVVIIEDAERTEEEGHNGTDIVEIGAEEDAASHQRPLSIADVLQVSMEEEYVEGKDCELAEGGGAWRRSGGEQGTGGGRSRRLRCAISPVRMKRSVSSGSSFFARQGKGRTSPLPI